MVNLISNDAVREKIRTRTANFLISANVHFTKLAFKHLLCTSLQTETF